MSGSLCCVMLRSAGIVFLLAFCCYVSSVEGMALEAPGRLGSSFLLYIFFTFDSGSVVNDVVGKCLRGEA